MSLRAVFRRLIRNATRIRDDSEQLANDMEWVNANRPDIVPPFDVGRERVAAKLAQGVLDALNRGETAGPAFDRLHAHMQQGDAD